MRPTSSCSAISERTPCSPGSATPSARRSTSTRVGSAKGYRVIRVGHERPADSDVTAAIQADQRPIGPLSDGVPGDPGPPRTTSTAARRRSRPLLPGPLGTTVPGPAVGGYRAPQSQSQEGAFAPPPVGWFRGHQTDLSDLLRRVRGPMAVFERPAPFTERRSARSATAVGALARTGGRPILHVRDPGGVQVPLGHQRGGPGQLHRGALGDRTRRQRDPQSPTGHVHPPQPRRDLLAGPGPGRERPPRPRRCRRSGSRPPRARAPASPGARRRLRRRSGRSPRRWRPRTGAGSSTGGTVRSAADSRAGPPERDHHVGVADDHGQAGQGPRLAGQPHGHVSAARRPRPARRRSARRRDRRPAGRRPGGRRPARRG